MIFALTAVLCIGAPLTDDKPAKACMVYYTGKVQGVGFRATTAEIARDYPVTAGSRTLPTVAFSC
jgi:hypothetical protein